MKLRLRKKDGAVKAARTVSAEASPDSKCPICLDRFNNMAYLDRCLHKFCFRCIHEWSKNKAECPLCKQPFNSIFHSIKAEDDFKEFVLRPTENGSFGSPEGRRFRYRTTQTRERWQSLRRVSPPPDHGVMFEGLMGSAPPQQDRGFQRIMLTMAARRRAQHEGRTVHNLREQETVTFRRALYRTGVRVRSVRDGGRYRDISAAFFQRNPACLHRLVPWLKRELTVLYGAQGSLVDIVLQIIMSSITRYDLEDQAIQDELRPFLLTRTEHFLHEFMSFARSPFNMEAYDQHAVYDCPAPSYEEGSSSNSSVIAISEDEANSVELNLRPVSVAGSALSQAPWDDETPGPSYSTTEQTQSPLLSVSESDSVSSREVAPQESTQVKSDLATKALPGEEDCVIVGYVKPMAERTPELVQLSSDSEESTHDYDHDHDPPAGEVPVLSQAQHVSFPSLSPLFSICSSASKQEQPAGRLEQGGQEWVLFEAKESCTPLHRASPAGHREGHSRPTGGNRRRSSEKQTRNKDDRKRQRLHGSRESSRSRSKERTHGSRGHRSRSTDWSWSARSPTISVNSDGALSRDRRHSRSCSRDCVSSKDRRQAKSQDEESRRGRRQDEESRRGRRRHEHSSHSYHWDSYYRERERTDALHAHNSSRSYSRSLYASSDYGARSRSPRSRSSTGSPSAHRRSRHDKPSGKRKYKTRHLEDSARQQARALSSPGLWEKRGTGERHHKKSRKKKSRSPSVEIIYEGRAAEEGRRHHKRKKKHKRKSRRHRSREGARHHSPMVITIDSDSDRDPVADDNSGTQVHPTTSQASDTNLLESILQDLEEHILPTDSGAVGEFSPKAASAELAPEGDKCEVQPSERERSVAPLEDEMSTACPTVESASAQPISLGNDSEWNTGD